MVDTGIECESFFQNKIDSMLVTTSWVDELKDLLEMEAVSQIWGKVPVAIERPWRLSHPTLRRY